jgi:hypothetical protein
MEQATGGIPAAFIDGHAESWPTYVLKDQLNTPGQPEGTSAIWCSPTQKDGGWFQNKGPYTLDTIIMLP